MAEVTEGKVAALNEIEVETEIERDSGEAAVGTLMTLHK